MNKGSQNNKRVEWVDIAKGIGIILVVLGHYLFNLKTAFIAGDIANSTITVIYLFHMPLFFFISGFLFKENKNILIDIAYQFKNLVIPYICFFFLVVPSLLLTNNLNSITLIDFAKYLWSGRYLVDDLVSLRLSAMWFLLCLFSTRTLYNLLTTKLNTKTIWCILIVCLILAYTNSIYKPNWQLPFCLNLTLFTVIIFHLGNLYKKYDKITVQWISIPLGILTLLSPIYLDIGTINIMMTYYGIPIITLACSIVTIIAVINLSKLLIKLKYLKLILTEIGKASLVIMALHLAIYHAIIIPAIGNRPLWGVVIAIPIGYLSYRLFNSFKVLQIAFLGKGISSKDIDRFVKHIK